MKNITITLDERIVAWVRRYAASHETSVSRMVGDLLRARMREQDDYDTAMRRYREESRQAQRKVRELPCRVCGDVCHHREGARSPWARPTEERLMNPGPMLESLE